MVDVPSSPREAGLTALLVMAETVVAKMGEEKGKWDWNGRTEVVESIALLGLVTRAAKAEQVSDVMERKTDELTIVERGRLFSVWSEKRRRLREG